MPTTCANKRTSLRISAAFGVLEGDAGNSEAVDRELLIRRQVAAQVDEALAGGQVLQYVVVFEIGQGGREFVGRVLGVGNLHAIGVQVHGREIGGNNDAVAIEDIGARAMGERAGAVDTGPVLIGPHR